MGKDVLSFRNRLGEPDGFAMSSLVRTDTKLTLHSNEMGVIAFRRQMSYFVLETPVIFFSLRENRVPCGSEKLRTNISVSWPDPGQLEDGQLGL